MYGTKKVSSNPSYKKNQNSIDAGQEAKCASTEQSRSGTVEAPAGCLGNLLPDSTNAAGFSSLVGNLRVMLKSCGIK